MLCTTVCSDSDSDFTTGNHVLCQLHWLVHAHRVFEIFLHDMPLAWSQEQLPVSSCASQQAPQQQRNFLELIISTQLLLVSLLQREQMMSAWSPGPIPASWQPKIHWLLIEKKRFASISLFFKSKYCLWCCRFIFDAALADSSLAINLWQVKQAIFISLVANPKFAEDTTISDCGMHEISVSTTLAPRRINLYDSCSSDRPYWYESR